MSDGNASFAALLGGEQRGSIHDWRMPPAEPHWLHLELTHEAEAWLLNKSRIDPVAFRALVAMGARPRCAAFDDGVLVVLRGVNTNEGSEPEDMVSLRMWIEKIGWSRLRRGQYLRLAICTTGCRMVVVRGRPPS